MRIAYLSSSLVPSRTANSVHVMKMSEAFSKVGHEVLLTARRGGRDSEDPAGTIWKFYGIEQNFEIYFSQWRFSAGGNLWAGWKAAFQALRWQVDIAYGRNLTACVLLTFRGIPVVFEAHSAIQNNGRLYRAAFRRMIRATSFSHLVVITEALAQNYFENWPELRGKILVASDGATALPEGVIKTAKLGSRAGRMQVGYTGHLYEGKGLDLVLNLARICNEFDFHVVGGTEQDVAYWRGRDDLPENFFLHGFRPHAEIPSYLLAFDVVLLPNQLEVHAHGGTQDIGRWTSPLKLFEYMAAGRAIVCSDIPVLREVAENEINMLLCQHDSVEEWAKAVRRLGASRDFREKLGVEARSQLESRYTWEIRAQKVLSPPPL